MLVFEGIMPFLNPAAWRRAVQALAGYTDATLRTLGLVAMLTGVLVLIATR